MSEVPIPESAKAECGIVYIATGSGFVREAVRSAETVRKVMPDSNICLITDKATTDSVFNVVIRVPDAEYGFVDQITYMPYSPYEQTLFLDTDIYVYEDVSELFDLLDRFDIAVAHNHNRQAWELNAVPESFPEYNSGVVVYRNEDEFRQFTEQWIDIYWEMADSPETQNQPSFRKALYESNLRIATLPTEYNCMVRYPGHAVGTVKIFHGRLLDIDTPGAVKYVRMSDAVEKINEFPDHRVFTTLGGIRVYSDRQHSRLRRFRYLVQRDGWIAALRRSGHWVVKKLRGEETMY